MKQKANILWVALTTFVMGYVVSALTQSGHAHSGAPAIIRIARPEGNASAPTSAGIARARRQDVKCNAQRQIPPFKKGRPPDGPGLCFPRVLLSITYFSGKRN